MVTYNSTQNVAFAGILVLHTQVSKHSSLILTYGGVVQAFYLRKFIGVNEVQRGRANELMGLKT